MPLQCRNLPELVQPPVNLVYYMPLIVFSLVWLLLRLAEFVVSHIAAITLVYSGNLLHNLSKLPSGNSLTGTKWNELKRGEDATTFVYYMYNMIIQYLNNHFPKEQSDLN